MRSSRRGENSLCPIIAQESWGGVKKVRKEGYSGYSDLFECFLNDNRDTRAMKLYMCIYIYRERKNLLRELQ